MSKQLTGIAFILISLNVHAETPTLPASRVHACRFAFASGEEKSAIRQALYDQIIARANQRIGHLIPGASVELKIEDGEITIRASGIPNGSAYIEGQINYLRTDVNTEMDAYPWFSEEQGGPSPLLTVLIKEIRVQDYLESETSSNRFRRMGLGSVLLNSLIDIIRLTEVRRFTGRFDQTNKEMFLENFLEHKDVEKATNATFGGQIFAVRGFKIERKYSPIFHPPGPDGLPRSYYVTWKI